MNGGVIGLWSGDLASLVNDMNILRPTNFSSTPMFWLAMKQKFDTEVQEFKKEHSTNDFDQAQNTVMSRWKQKRLVGNRCNLILIGGASSSENLRNWIFHAIGAVVVDGYGTSETGAISRDGTQLQSIKMQLVDIPEMGYFTSDKPYPRGEVVAKSGRTTPGKVV